VNNVLRANDDQEWLAEERGTYARAGGSCLCLMSVIEQRGTYVRAGGSCCA
jgi:hypothetical protein